MKTIFAALLLCLFLPFSAVMAQTDDSGRVDLAPLAGSLGVTPKVNINFGPAMMAGFAETLRQANPELAGVLGGVTGLRVMVFEGVDTRGADTAVFANIHGTLDPVVIGCMIGSIQGGQGFDLQGLMGQFQN